jgi:hypothetical protein
MSREFKLTEDKLVASIIERANIRANAGFLTYGDTMEDATKPTKDWITDAQEELWDAIVYLEKLKTLINDPDT